MNTDVAEYPRDVNGIPIKPGYRKPFTSESAKLHVLKSVAVKREKRQARLLSLANPGLKPSEVVEIAAIISVTLRQYRRCVAACVAANNGKDAALWSKAACDAFECWQTLLGNPMSKVSKRKPSVIPTIAPVAPTQPNPVAHSVSGVVGVFGETCQAQNACLEIKQVGPEPIPSSAMHYEPPSNYPPASLVV